jgi:hypothetical protein
MSDAEFGGVEVAEHTGPGFCALIQSGGDWIAAIMNGRPDSWKIPDEIEQHPRTDELFVLVSGRAHLLTAGDGPAPGAIRQTPMRKGMLYNVKAGTWHGSPMSTDARFIIVEGKDGGSVRVPLTAEQKAAVKIEETA